MSLAYLYNDMQRYAIGISVLGGAWYDIGVYRCTLWRRTSGTPVDSGRRSRAATGSPGDGPKVVTGRTVGGRAHQSPGGVADSPGRSGSDVGQPRANGNPAPGRTRCGVVASHQLQPMRAVRLSHEPAPSRRGFVRFVRAGSRAHGGPASQAGSHLVAIWPGTAERPPSRVAVFVDFMGFFWSGRPDSNRRHSAWKADTLPTELLPRVRPSLSLKGCEPSVQRVHPGRQHAHDRYIRQRPGSCCRGRGCDPPRAKSPPGRVRNVQSGAQYFAGRQPYAGDRPAAHPAR